jgi:hypothetical protein
MPRRVHLGERTAPLWLECKCEAQVLVATQTSERQFLCNVRCRGRINFCLTLLVMLVVGLVFAGMFLFIKFTSFAGYRAARVQPATSTSAAAGEL